MIYGGLTDHEPNRTRMFCLSHGIWQKLFAYGLETGLQMLCYQQDIVHTEEVVTSGSLPPARFGSMLEIDSAGKVRWIAEIHIVLYCSSTRSLHNLGLVHWNGVSNQGSPRAFSDGH